MKFKNYFDLIWTKATFDIKTEFDRTYLSYLWVLIEPFLYVATFYIVFDVLFSSGKEDFVLYITIGMIGWLWYAKSVSVAATSIISNAVIIKSFPVSPIIFPFISVFFVTIKQIPIFLVMLTYVLYEGFYPTYNWFSLLPIVLVYFLFITLSSTLVAAIVPYIRDLNAIIPSILMLLMFMSGIFFDFRGTVLDDYILLNPVAHVLMSIRDILIYDLKIDYLVYLTYFFVLLILHLPVVYFYKINGSKYSNVLSE